MNLTALDWAAVSRLREIFLEGKPLRRAYWESENDLAAYDLTLGERIGWKWDAVLTELKARNWSPPPGPLLDFGCGSGIAGRRVVAAFGPSHFSALHVHDRSPLAEGFALKRAQTAFPKLTCERLKPEELTATTPLGTLLVSHVLSELPPKDQARLAALASRAQCVLWVEPGTQSDSRALIAVRELLRPDFAVVAPCTHDAACGLTAPERTEDWCHFFGRPPWEIFTDSAWSEFGRRLGIDLRSLPYSFLVLQRRGLPSATTCVQGCSRTLGHARIYKGYAKVLTCEAAGVADLTLQKRDAPKLFKALKDGEAEPLQRWERTGDRIVPIDG
jgi:hypothetical protein